MNLSPSFHLENAVGKRILGELRTGALAALSGAQSAQFAGVCQHKNPRALLTKGPTIAAWIRHRLGKP
jgi:hypothetical protein